VTTNSRDFSKLIDNLPATLSELARLSDVSERSINRMKAGNAVQRSTANKVLRGLSQIYNQELTLDNVTGINIYGG
jgi:predicted transcriptional regulator